MVMEVWGAHPLLHSSTATSKWCQDGIQKDRPAWPFSSGKEERSPLPLVLLVVCYLGLSLDQGTGKTPKPKRVLPPTLHTENWQGKRWARCRSWLPSPLHTDHIPWESPRSESWGHCVQCWPLAQLSRCHGQCGWTKMWGWLDHSLSQCACLFEQADTVILGCGRAEATAAGRRLGSSTYRSWGRR